LFVCFAKVKRIVAVHLVWGPGSLYDSTCILPFDLKRGKERFVEELIFVDRFLPIRHPNLSFPRREW